MFLDATRAILKNLEMKGSKNGDNYKLYKNIKNIF